MFKSCSQLNTCDPCKKCDECNIFIGSCVTTVSYGLVSWGTPFLNVSPSAVEFPVGQTGATETVTLTAGVTGSVDPTFTSVMQLNNLGCGRVYLLNTVTNLQIQRPDKTWFTVASAVASRDTSELPSHNLVYVCPNGKNVKPTFFANNNNLSRSVYRSDDGGVTYTQILNTPTPIAYAVGIDERASVLIKTITVFDSADVSLAPGSTSRIQQVVTVSNNKPCCECVCITDPCNPISYDGVSGYNNYERYVRTLTAENVVTIPTTVDPNTCYQNLDIVETLSAFVGGVTASLPSPSSLSFVFNPSLPFSELTSTSVITNVGGTGSGSVEYDATFTFNGGASTCPVVGPVSEFAIVTTTTV